MRVAGLFSGVGGFELALLRAGFENTLLVEKDHSAQLVLRDQFPNCPLVSDIADVDDIPDGTDLVTAGFPCQNLSMAGDKSGIDGSKSGIVERMFELIARSSVEMVLIENVYFMLQLDRGNGMRRLCDRFEAMKYQWAYRVIDTQGFGLPQRRRRVYMLASKKLDPRYVLFADETSSTLPVAPDITHPLGFYWTEGRTGVGLTVDGIPPLKVGSALGIASAPAVLFPDGEVLMPSISAGERLQGFPSDWTRHAHLSGARKPEWRLIGNAVSVPVVTWISERIKNPGSVIEFRTFAITDGGKWPDAAFNIGKGRIGVAASDKPIVVNRLSISSFRDQNWTRLSDRALNGFIGRAIVGGLKMPDGFLNALRDAPRKIREAA